MSNVGIIVAMKEEMDEIKKILENSLIDIKYNVEFLKGNIGQNNVILAQARVGKVNAARITQMMIDNYKIDYIINVGSAGALDPNLNIGDIVIGDKLIQHDFDITAFNHKKGYITDVGDYLDSDKELVKKLNDIINDNSGNEYQAVIGTIASGDIFCTEVKMKEKIFSKFDAKCVEMEGAAIAQVCYLDKIPFVVIRSISDSPNGNNAIVFKEFVKLASSRCAEILEKLMKK